MSLYRRTPPTQGVSTNPSPPAILAVPSGSCYWHCYRHNVVTVDVDKCIASLATLFVYLVFYFIFGTDTRTGRAKEPGGPSSTRVRGMEIASTSGAPKYARQANKQRRGVVAEVQIISVAERLLCVPPISRRSTTDHATRKKLPLNGRGGLVSACQCLPSSCRTSVGVGIFLTAVLDGFPSTAVLDGRH